MNIFSLFDEFTLSVQFSLSMASDCLLSYEKKALPSCKTFIATTLIKKNIPTCENKNRCYTVQKNKVYESQAKNRFRTSRQKYDGIEVSRIGQRWIIFAKPFAQVSSI